MKKLILFLLIICLVAGVANAAMRKGPYLIYTGVNTEMMVLWQLDSTQSCTIEWGTSTAYSDGNVQTTEYGSDHQHEKVITGLSVGTKYYYRVNDGTSHTGTFYTAPAASATSVKILAFGDTRNEPQAQDPVNARMISTYTADPGYQSLLLCNGDYADSGRTESEWTRDWFSRSYSNMVEMRKNIPINGCYSNHDTTSTGGDDGCMYGKYLPYPFVSPAPHFLCDNAHYWSFDYGPVHVIVMDEYDETIGLFSQSQLDWMASDLAATGKPWKIVLGHEPGWAAGSHGNDSQVQDELQPLLLDYGVQMYIAGHNHNYARAVVQQVQHLCTGGGGAPLANITPGEPFVVLAEKTYNFVTLDFSGDNCTITAIRQDGTTIESFSISKNPAPELPWGDDFESGDFAGWERANTKDVVISTDSYEGTYSAKALKAGWFETSVSTLGFTDIHVKYARKTVGLDASDYFHVEWSTDGTAWYNLESTQDTAWSFVDKTCASGADNSRTFRIRFRSQAGPSEGGIVDDVQVTGTAAAADTTAPTPDPMTFATAPYATGSSSIEMVATTATDASGVEYYFTCTAGGGNDSGWLASTTYEDVGLSPSTQYTYTVKARDKSTNQNETAASSGQSATTNAADSTAPTPDPMTFATAPYATGDSSIAMVATTATDASGVEYYFDCTAGGGNDSGWQDGTNYEDTGLSASTQYTYTVQARDKSVNQNATAASSGQSATTDASDSTAPIPDPMTFATAPYATGQTSIAMVASTATDVSGVEYYFDCTAGGGNDSGWQDSTSYEDTGLTASTQYTYTVQARDKSAAQNATAASSGQSATTDAQAGLLPFNDTFVVYGDFDTGGWTTGGYSTNVLNQCTCEGPNGAQMKGVSWIEKAISTEGYTDIEVSYWRRTNAFDAGEYILAEWYDGTSWNEFESAQVSTCGFVTQYCSSGADNNANFKIRFSTNASKTNEYGCIDDVTIDGTVQ